MEEKEKEGGAENETRVLSRILSLGGKLYKVLSRGVWGHAPQDKC